MKNPLGYIGLFIVLFIVGYFFAKREMSKASTVQRTQIILGTVINIKVRDAAEDKANEAITKAFDEIKRIDREFSSYKKESPVWKLNHSKDSIISVPPEIYSLMEKSNKLWKLSGGAFDVSLETLTEAWGFNGDNPSIPGEQKRIKAWKQSGWQHVHLLGDNKFTRDVDVELNFGANAKGYAVDRAVETLKANGIKNALVNAGGEIRELGSEWIVGIQHPRRENDIIGRVKLNGMAVATSGDYEQYFIKDGKRYDHIMNPKTGFPADACQSVTVIADNDTDADGLSTAVFVLGPEKGMKLIESLPNTEAMIIDSSGQMTTSTGFHKYLLR